MKNKRVRSAASVLLATALTAGGSLFAQAPAAQAPAANDERPEFSRFQDVELRLVRFQMDGKEIVIPPGITITATFHKAGQISGRSAVNSYQGVFTAAPNGKIAVRLTTATQMAGSSGLMELESKYFDTLSNVQQILPKPDRIVLGNENTSLEFAFSRVR